MGTATPTAEGPAYPKLAFPAPEQAPLVAACAKAPTAPDAPPVPAAFRGSESVLTLPTGEPVDRTRRVYVWRPPGPDSARYPVVYLLHGLPGNPMSALHVSGAQGDADQWAYQGHLPVVFVVPDGRSSAAKDPEWGDDVRRRFAFEHWMLRTVIPSVEGTHPRPARLRAVVGFSMGAFGAMDYYLRHRDVFGQVAALAGYWRIDDPDGVFGTSARTRAAWDPVRLAARATGGRVLIVSSCRSKDEPMVAALRAHGADVTHVRLVGGHTWLLVRDNLPAVIRWLSERWR